jgi:hypothetical protein
MTGPFAQLWRRNDRFAVCGQLVTVPLLFVFDLSLVQSSTEEVSWVPGGMPCSCRIAEAAVSMWYV